mgnify:CR=1 FL=1
MQMQYYSIGMCCIYCTKCGCHSFLVALAMRGFSPVEFEEAVVKAKGLLIKSAQDYYYCDCFALLLQLRGQEALQ